MRKIIVAVAPVALDASEHIKNPLTPEKIADEIIAATQAGASMVHLHVRDSEGNPTEELTEFSRTLSLIRKGSDIIIQGSTGGMSTLSLEQRCVSLNDPLVEVASLNMGSTNFDESVYINTLPDIRYWVARMKEKKIHPELEVFEGGMINNVLILAKEGLLNPPFTFNFALGVRGALPADAYNLHFLKGMLPADSIWGLMHHGMTDFSLLVASVAMGASIVRVGFEDSFYYAPGKIASTNTQLVEKVTSLLKDLGFEIATPAEARKILGLNNNRK